MISYVDEFGRIDGQMIMQAHNICMWYDGTLKPKKGHVAKCRWAFDGQIWWHK